MKSNAIRGKGGTRKISRKKTEKTSEKQFFKLESESRNRVKAGRYNKKKKTQHYVERRRKENRKKKKTAGEKNTHTHTKKARNAKKARKVLQE